MGRINSTWEGTGLENMEIILNISLPAECLLPYHWVEGDAWDMNMFESRHFDVIFSNSVIEHVGDFSKQGKMEAEISRVANKYWVQTPFKHFPLEIHFLFPLFQYLPISLRLHIAKIWSFPYAKRMNLESDLQLKNI